MQVAHTAPGKARGAVATLAAAALFGLSAPLAKLLLRSNGPVMLAGLLYIGAGIALTLFQQARRITGTVPRETPVRHSDWPLLAGMIACGGVLAPVLLLFGLSRLSGSTGALLLNLEAPLTIILAVTFFGEHLSRRETVFVCAILAGATLLELRPGGMRGDPWGVLAIVGAGLGWAVDNNLTQKLSIRDPIDVVRLKGLAAGAANLAIALIAGARFPAARDLLLALLLGSMSYGASLVLAVHGMRLLGAAREAAWFSTAPFLGALGALPILGERLTPADILAGAVMAVGVLGLASARHGHSHVHEELMHEHAHSHDDQHHQHAHVGAAIGTHSHPHRHAALVHDHPHVSDLHHRHGH